VLWNCKVWLELGANPAILAPMKHRIRPAEQDDLLAEQDDLLRPRLVDMINPRHELVRLAALIDWDWFEREWAGFFPSQEGRPATHPRLVAGLLYLQHACGLSDEAAVARWVENPCYQHFTGETFSSTNRRCTPPRSAAGAAGLAKKEWSGCWPRPSRPAAGRVQSKRAASPRWLWTQP
jgi:hypothetical protein